MKKEFCILAVLLSLSIISPFTLFSQNNSNSISDVAVKLNVDHSFFTDFVPKKWTTEDGLPGMTITALIQDKKGYIWIGTYDGLVRFDGVEFKIYSRTQNPKYDFASARSLCEDSDGNIWIGHNDEGVTRMGADGSVKKFTMDDGLPNNKVNAVCEDKNENIWIGTASGLCYIKPDGMLVVPDGLKELDQEKILVAKLFCDMTGTVWITTGVKNDCFVYKENKVERFTGITKIKDPAIRTVSQDKTGALCFGVDPYYVVRIGASGETVFDASHPGGGGTAVEAIIQDSFGNYWFAMDSGITVLHDSTYTYYDKTNGLVENVVVKLIEDYEGNIWIGFNRGGLQKLSKGKFKTVNIGITVNAICEDVGRGVTWLGTDNGVMCYDGTTFLENPVTKLCSGFRVRHVALTKDGELLISSYSDMPQIKVSSDGKIKIWTEKDGIANKKCRVAIKTASGDYYIGTTDGLNIVHHEDGHISTLTKEDGFSNHYIMWLYEDSKQKIWVGTNGGGVYLLDGEKILRHYTTDEGLAGNVIFKILEIKGNIWIGTGTGLSKYIEESDSFVNFNSRNGLETDSVFQMICDQTDTVWMTTNKGVFSADLSDMEEIARGEKEKLIVKYYGAADGFVTSGVTSTSLSSKDSLGRVWFTLVDGFAVYDPSKNAKSQKPAKVVIQEYSVDNSFNEYHGETISVPADAKRLSIKYTGLSFCSPENVQFKFKLEGFEKEFSDWGRLRTVSYTNLKPGAYRFLVMSKSNDGVESNSVAATIIKESYIWQNAWFWMIATILSAYLIAFFARLHIKNRIRKIETKAAEELEFNKAIIGAFANCVDGKDEYTNGHSNRVAKYTKMLAQKLGESAENVQKFYNIALLHDIGKIGVPDAILNKPGKLDDAEFAIMKSHAQRGYEILKDVHIQEDLAAGAHHHHERFDGKGYPDGLSDYAIPWVARIIAVADTFDAMSSTRPYRKKLPADFIVNEIEHCAGTQFDPKVVEKFMELYREGAFDDVLKSDKNV